MKSLALCLTAGLLLSWTHATHAQRNFDDVEIQSTHVGGNVHMLEGAGGNIGVSVGSDGLLIIDDQFAPLAEKIEAALDDLDQGELKFVLNTHWHGDHTGGNPHFGRQAPIIAHSNVRKRLANKENPAVPKEGLPVITFDHSLALHFNGEEINVIHVPTGHTDGDSVIWFTQSNVAHLGDQFFNGRFPFIDLNSGGDVEGYIRNVEKILEKLPEEAQLIPGHGPLGTVDDLKTFHRMLVECADAVRQAIDDGKDLEQIQSDGVPERWEDWSWGFIDSNRWLEILYNSLNQS